MASNILTFDYYYSSGFHTVYTVTGSVTKEEEYRTTPVDNFSAFWSDRKGTKVSTWDIHLRLKSQYTQGQRLACYIQEYETSGNTSYSFNTYNANVFDFSGTFKDEYGDTSTKSYAVLPFEYWTTPDAMSCPIMCNLPVFDNQTHAEQYINAINDEVALSILELYALNYSAGEYVDEELKEYVYYGRAEEYTVDEFGNATMTSSPALYRGIRIKSKQRCSLYEIAGIDGGVLKLGMNFQGVENAYYSDDFGETWQQMAGQPTQIPFGYLYRNWAGEIGTFYALTLDRDADYPTNMFVYKNREDSDAYNDGGDNETDAVNYNSISTGYTPQNRTGEDDDETTFGVIGIRSIFSQQYIISEGALSEIANAFYDVSQGGATGIFEDIKKGCEMYGDTVVDDIESLVFYPVNLNSVFSSGIISQNYIYFGGYQFNMQHSVNRILFPNGYYDFGTFQIETTFGDNIRSYEPYTKLYCYLAYIGWVQLDMKKYLHKSVNVRYYFDTRANTCCAVLVANGVMCDYFNGQCGVSMPLRATDMNAYANAQIQTLLGFGSGVGGRINDAQKVGSQLAQAGATAGETIAGAGALGVLGVGLQGTKTLYGLTQNNINNFNHTLGASSSIINMYLPQECLFMFEVQDAMPTEYEKELVGLPSNASGLVGSFNGYLECEQVNLVCSGATAKEQAEIIRYLYNGVYI